MEAPTHPIANIYVARALDPVVEIACAVSHDFVARPHHYKRVPDQVVGLLENFRSSLGNHPEWLSASQRNFASCRLINRFSSGFAGIRLSAIRYINSVSGPGGPIARRSCMEAAELLRASTQPLEGAGLSAIERVNSTMLARAVTILSSSSVSEAFGVAEVPSGDWPQGGMFSPQLGYLCESVSQTFNLDRPVFQPKLSVLQRAAHHGAATISGILDASLTEADADRVSDVMYSASAWAAALGNLLSSISIPRAWSEPAYRRGLHCLERDIMPPHPSGEIDLEGTIRTASPGFPSAVPVSQAFRAMTFTVDIEVCCSTGDFCCGPTGTNGQCDLSDDCPTLTQ
jgi:mersacidin/lichenicidin family type 2 lantibiotic